MWEPARDPKPEIGACLGFSGECAESVSTLERFRNSNTSLRPSLKGDRLLEYAAKAPSLEIFMRCLWLLEQDAVQKHKNELPLMEVIRRLKEMAEAQAGEVAV